MFKLNRQFLVTALPLTAIVTSAARPAAGSACMRRYGYRLKKGS
jgi:hypothetical protein